MRGAAASHAGVVDAERRNVGKVGSGSGRDGGCGGRGGSRGSRGAGGSSASGVGAEVENDLTVDDERVVGLTQVLGDHLVASLGQVEHVADSDVDDTQEALVLLFELFVVKDLHDNDGRRGHVDVERLVPVGVERLLDDGGGSGLAPIHKHDSEGVGETEHIPFV